MRAEFIEYQESLVHYFYVNRGPRLVVCLHGYDETGFSFDILKDVLPAGCSLLALDLPYHGNTSWGKSKFEAEVLWDIIGRICAKHEWQHQSFELAGYSMGGRIALSLLQFRPEKVDRMILLAPDGLSGNFWYRISTGTMPGRKLFAFTMKHPGWFLFTLRVANKLRFINPAVFKFSWFYLKDPVARGLLYKRWMIMRWMRPDLPEIKQQILTRDIPVLLVYGSFDRIMPASDGVEFCRNTHDLCKLEVLPCGHQILQIKNKKHLSKIFRRVKF